MLKSSFIRDCQTTIPLLLALSSSFHIVKAQQTVNTNSTTSTSASTSSCTPLNCIAKCTPNCSNEETCILRTMTNCAVCPASQCMSRTALGLPPLSTSSNNSTNNQPSTSDSSSNSGLIGGLVGGLLGLGILIGIGVFCYIKRGKKKRKLPFAFTEGGVGIMSQEQFNRPHPTIASSFVQQNRSMTSTVDPNTSRYNIGMSELSPTSPTSPTSTILSTTGGQKNRSMIHPVSHISTNNNSHINNGSTLSLHDNIVNNNQSNNNSNSNIVLPPNNKSTPSNFAENNTILASPILSNSQATVIPEEFEEKIAIQNKRISQILHNNPRISRTSYNPQIQENRFSGISYTTDEDSEYDDDDKSVNSSAVKQAVTRSPYQPQLATQAVQVSRAKVQIMRVNSVRTNSGGNGLGRSDSVRTILTSAPPSVLPHLDSTESSSFADSFPSTPNNRSFPNEDPFLDTINNIKQ